MPLEPENRTPSAIEIDDDSERRRWESHESLGYKRASATSYSLARSPTPPNPLPPSDPPSAIPIIDENRLESSLPHIGDTSIISSRAPDEYIYRKGNTTRVLEHAFDNGPIGSQQRYTVIPPRASHSKYVDYTREIRDPKVAYTQVLVWCLQRRIDKIERTPPRDLTTSKQFELLRVLKSMQSRLVEESIVPRWQTHELLHLKPQMPNPENRSSAEIIGELDSYKRKLHDEMRQSWDLLQRMESALTTSQPEDASGEGSRRPAEQYNAIAGEALGEGTENVRSILESMAHLDALSATAMATVMETIAAENEPFIPNNQ